MKRNVPQNDATTLLFTLQKPVTFPGTFNVKRYKSTLFSICHARAQKGPVRMINECPRNTRLLKYISFQCWPISGTFLRRENARPVIATSEKQVINDRVKFARHRKAGSFNQEQSRCSNQRYFRNHSLNGDDISLN